VLYSTVAGQLGVLLPITSHEEVDFLGKIEAHLRVKNPALLGNNHMRHRASAQGPVLRVIDGDLVETYAGLPHQLQREIAVDLGRETQDILRKLEDIRKVIL
jgi:splicing factor 3B subunit 3